MSAIFITTFNLQHIICHILLPSSYAIPSPHMSIHLPIEPATSFSTNSSISSSFSFLPPPSYPPTTDNCTQTAAPPPSSPNLKHVAISIACQVSSVSCITLCIVHCQPGVTLGSRRCLSDPLSSISRRGANTRMRFANRRPLQ